jgi:hypothetical protein
MRAGRDCACHQRWGQEEDVVPLFKIMQYGFIPLKGTRAWVDLEYHVRVLPTTLLVGADGRVYFHPHMYDRIEERTAALEGEELPAPLRAHEGFIDVQIPRAMTRRQH